MYTYVLVNRLAGDELDLLGSLTEVAGGGVCLSEGVLYMDW